MIDFLLQYWYLGLVVLIVSWEIARFILKRIFRRVFGIVFAPLRKFFNVAFGNQKWVNVELLSLLFLATLFIVYLLYTR